MSKSPSKQLVETYLDGFRANDHDKILDCLSDDVEWTVFGHFYLTGKEAYGNAIEGPGFVGPPQLEVVRMVEEGNIVMAELLGWAPQEAGEPVRLSMAEVFVIRDGKIAERRAWVIPLTENRHR